VGTTANVVPTALVRMWGAVFLSVVMSACASPSDSVPSEVADTGSPSVRVDTGLDTGPDAAAPPDASADLPADSRVDADPGGIPYDPARWMEPPGDCGEGTSYSPVSTADFAIPDNPTVTDRFTAAPLLADQVRQSTSILADNALEPTAGSSNTVIYANPGEAADFHIGSLNNYDDLSSFQISVTVMVDYRPVEARFTRLSDDRSSVLDSWSGVSGIGFQAEKKVELIDVTIPVSELEPGRMNEVAIALSVHTVERRPVTHFQRFNLFYGGWERPPRPCVREPRSMDPLSVEIELNQIFGSGNMFAFTGQFNRALDLRSRLLASPGEKVTIFASLRAWEEPEPLAMVPVLNGQPLGPVWWQRQSTHPLGSFAQRRIDMRRSIELEMPREPGVYNFQIITWPDPFEVRVHPNGDVLDEGVKNKLLDRSSNHLTFEVVE